MKNYPTEDGIITGRNGTYDIKAVQVSDFGNLARIDGVSKSKEIVINGGISMDKTTMDEIARDWLKKQGYLVDVLWHVDDIIMRAEELGIDLSEDQAREIATDIMHNFDACYGISWDTIDCYIDDYVKVEA